MEKISFIVDVVYLILFTLCVIIGDNIIASWKSLFFGAVFVLAARNVVNELSQHGERRRVDNVDTVCFIVAVVYLIFFTLYVIIGNDVFASWWNFFYGAVFMTAARNVVNELSRRSERRQLRIRQLK